MGIREHIKIVDYVELHISKFTDIDWLLAHYFLIGLFGVFVHVVARPNSYLTVIESGKQASVRGE